MANSSEQDSTRTTREVSALIDSQESGVQCPSCREDIPLEELFLEGGGTCPGCAREVNLYVEVGERINTGNQWRNIPKGTEEMYR